MPAEWVTPDTTDFGWIIDTERSSDGVQSLRSEIDAGSYPQTEATAMLPLFIYDSDFSLTYFREGSAHFRMST